jgi:RNA polymerase sigma-70 factor (ECF subfamily)
MSSCAPPDVAASSAPRSAPTIARARRPPQPDRESRLGSIFEPSRFAGVTLPNVREEAAARGVSATGGTLVRPLPFASDADLVAGLLESNPAAMGAFYDRYATHVLRVLARVLGSGDRDLADLQHEVFVRAYSSIQTLADPNAVRAWLMSIAVFTARICIQRRSRRRWLRFFAPEELPDPAVPAADHEASAALRATYAILERMPADDRVAFALRFIEGLELTAVAAACGVSLATIKRRLARAERSFTTRAGADPVLAEWLEGGARWGAKAAR